MRQPTSLPSDPVLAARELFASARSRRASTAAKQRAADAAVTVVASATLHVTATHAAAKYAWALGTKWAALAGVVGVGATVAFVAVRPLVPATVPPAGPRSVATVRAAVPGPRRPPVPVPSASTPPFLSGADVPVVDVRDLPVVPAPSARAATGPTSGAVAVRTPPDDPVAPAGASVGAELAALDRTRTALASGDAVAALSTLDEYAASFPRGTMASAATVLRIEALKALGDRALARRLAQAFLAEHADSPYASHVTSILSELSTNP